MEYDCLSFSAEPRLFENSDANDSYRKDVLQYSKKMNKIEVKCCINGEPEMGNSSLYVARTESWEQVLYKISLKVNKPQGPNSIVYNELGGQITSVSELEDGDKIYFSVNGEAFVPPASSGNRSISTLFV